METNSDGLVSPQVSSSEADDPEAGLYRMDSRPHPIDVRLSIPLFGKKQAYVVLLGGMERRHRDRLERESGLYPLLTLGNVLALAAVVALIYALALIAIVAFDGMLPGI